MLPRFLKLTRWLSIPIFIICVAIAVRAPFLWSNHLNYDYFHLGRYLGRSPQQGASVLNIGLFGTACDWFICDPGHVRGRMYIHHIQRGYENIVAKLSALGADIRVVVSDQ